MPKCPQDCQDKHNKHEVTMTKIFGALDNIKDKLEENTRQHEEIIQEFKLLAEKKADKEDLEKLESQINGERKKTSNFERWFYRVTIGVLTSVCVYLLIKYVFIPH